MADLQQIMPGPKDDTVHRIITRDSTKSIFKLCVGVGNATSQLYKKIKNQVQRRHQPGECPKEKEITKAAAAAKVLKIFRVRISRNSTQLNRAEGMGEGKSRLVARKVKRALCTEYIIASSAEADISSRDGSNIVAKLRSNFRNTRHTFYSREPRHKGRVFSSIFSTDVASIWHTSSNKIFPRVPAGNHKVAHVAHDGFLDCPTNMQRSLGTIPASVMDPDVSTRTSTEVLAFTPDDCIPFGGLVRSKKSKSGVTDYSGTADLNESVTGGHLNEGRHLVLRNMTPRIIEENCKENWCLIFKSHGLASRETFQLVAAMDPNEKPRWTRNIDNVLLQVAKVGERRFTVQYRYPLSRFQAIAIVLSIVDFKVVHIILHHPGQFLKSFRHLI